jgi:hypothetical protein
MQCVVENNNNTVLYSHVLSFYIIDLTTVFYVNTDVFKKFKYFMLSYLTEACYCNFGT